MVSQSTKLHRNNQHSRRQELRIIIAVVASAFIVRALILLSSTRDPAFLQPLVDARTYHDLAVQFSQRGIFTEHFLWQAIYYPTFLAGVYRVFGVSILAVKILQLLLGVVVCLLTYLLARKLFGRRTALIAGLIVAVYGPLVFFETQLLATGWTTFWSVVLGLLVVDVDRQPVPKKLFVLGIVNAIALLTRPTFLPVFLALSAWLIWSLRRRGFAWSTVTYRVGTAVVGFIMFVVPTALVVHSATDRVGVIPPSGGINLYIGNNAKFSDTINIRPGFGWEELLGQPRQQGYGEDPWSGQPYFLGLVADYARQHPVSYARGLVRKTLHLASSRELPRTLDIYLHRQWSPVLSVVTFKVGAWGFPFGVLFPLAFVGFVMSYRRIPAPLVITLLVYSAAIVFVFVSARYRTPLIPLLAIFAAEGAVTIVRRIRTRRWRSLSVIAVVVLPSILISTLPGPFAQETVDLEPELYCGVGYNLYRQQRWDEALTYLSRAVELDPEMPAPQIYLGIALAELQQYEESENHFTEALRLKPDDTEAQNNLNVVKRRRADFHFREGRRLESKAPAASTRHYELAVDSAPDWPEPLARLAWMLATANVDSLRDGIEAIRFARLARVHLGRDDPYLQFVLAAAQAEAGNREEAVAIAEQALESALAAGDFGLGAQIREALAKFRIGQPWRQ